MLVDTAKVNRQKVTLGYLAASNDTKAINEIFKLLNNQLHEKTIPHRRLIPTDITVAFRKTDKARFNIFCID